MDAWVVVRKVFKIRISHNRIQMYLKAAGLAHDDPKKKNQRKWVRYEREHSLSAGHIDWHESDWSDLKVCVVIDDASRMIFAGGEFNDANTENISSLWAKWSKDAGGSALKQVLNTFGTTHKINDNVWV